MKKAQTPIVVTELTFGKVPPQAIDFEKAVIGGLLLESEAIYEVMDILQTDSFYKTENQTIYNAIVDMNKKGSKVDLLTVTDTLRGSGDLEAVGGEWLLTSYTNDVASTANIRYHALVIEEKAIKRRMIRLCHDTINSSFDDTSDTFNVLEALQFSVMNKLHKVVIGKNVEPNNRMDSTISHINANLSRKGKLIGIPTGSELLNQITGGFRGGKLIVVAGKPGQGKTAWALHNIKAALIENTPTLFFSLEMPTHDIDYRLIASEMGIYYKKIMNGNLFEDEYATTIDIANQLRNIPLFIDDSTFVTTDILRTKIYKYVRDYGVKFVVIDYLNLIRMTSLQNNMRTDQAYGDIVNSIRAIARDMDIPIVLLCQLSKEVDKRGPDKRPTTGDLKETSTIEQSADIILFPYRPSGHGVTIDADGIDVSKISYILVRKNKQGDSPLDIPMGCDIGMNQYWEVQLEGSEYKQVEKPIRITN